MLIDTRNDSLVHVLGSDINEVVGAVLDEWLPQLTTPFLLLTPHLPVCRARCPLCDAWHPLPEERARFTYVSARMSGLESGAYDALKGQEFFPTEYQVETTGKLKPSSSLGAFGARPRSVPYAP